MAGEYYRQFIPDLELSVERATDSVPTGREVSRPEKRQGPGVFPGPETGPGPVQAGAERERIPTAAAARGQIRLRDAHRPVPGEQGPLLGRQPQVSEWGRQRRQGRGLTCLPAEEEGPALRPLVRRDASATTPPPSTPAALYDGFRPEKAVPYVENPIPADTLDTVICGSSERMAELPDNSVHLMVTSPPYNVGQGLRRRPDP